MSIASTVVALERANAAYKAAQAAPLAVAKRVSMPSELSPFVPK